MTTAPAPVVSHLQPAGWSQRCTLRDDNAEHQIRIDGYPLYVSCTCRASGQANKHGPSYTPIAHIITAEQALTIWREHHQETT